MQRCICIGLLIVLLLKYGDANCVWTRYFNEDDPSGTGDNETLSSLRREYPGEICANPIAIDARVRGVRTPFQQTNETVTANLVDGFICLNSLQHDGRCMDYEVRFCCRPLQNCQWTRFYDRDDPSVTGDLETLAILRRENRGEICARPHGIDARVVDTHLDYSLTGEVLTISPRRGLRCLNANQTDRQCMDYEIRFCCAKPRSRCIWTKYYDRGNPGEGGDFELLSLLRIENPGEICQNPALFDARVVGTGLNYALTGEVVTANTDMGLFCSNGDQTQGICSDYEIRFCCYRRCTWTRYYNRDRSGSTGDHETLATLQRENPGLCPTPLDFQARTSGTKVPYFRTGQRLTASVTMGLRCLNNDQNDGKCMDYEVRFCCPPPANV